MLNRYYWNIFGGNYHFCRRWGCRAVNRTRRSSRTWRMWQRTCWSGLRRRQTGSLRRSWCSGTVSAKDSSWLSLPRNSVPSGMSPQLSLLLSYPHRPLTDYYLQTPDQLSLPPEFYPLPPEFYLLPPEFYLLPPDPYLYVHISWPPTPFPWPPTPTCSCSFTTGQPPITGTEYSGRHFRHFRSRTNKYINLWGINVFKKLINNWLETNEYGLIGGKK